MCFNLPNRRPSYSASIDALHVGRERQGLTLLELMIALSLLSVLILVAWSLFNSLAMVDEKGHAQIKRVQVLRGLQSIIAEDLNARFREAPQEFSPPSFSEVTLSVDEPSTFSSALENPSATPGLAMAPPTNIHFVGSAQSLEFSVMSPPSLRERIEHQDDLDPVNRVLDGSDLYHSEMGSGAPNAVDNSIRSSVPSSASTLLGTQKVTVKYRFEKTVDGESGGFIRSMSDRSSGFNTPQPNRTDEILDGSDLYGFDASADLELSADEPIADSVPTRKDRVEFPEIGDLQIRYHDGTQWLNEWDAKQMGSYPAALEIQFELLSNRELREIRQEAAERAERGELDELSELNAELAENEVQVDEELESTLETDLSTTGDTEIRLPYRVIIPIEPQVAKEMLRQRMPLEKSMGMQGGLR